MASESFHLGMVYCIFHPYDAYYSFLILFCTEETAPSVIIISFYLLVVEAVLVSMICFYFLKPKKQKQKASVL
ncbi:unnamed protein product [Musa hybrid cultivar]